MAFVLLLLCGCGGENNDIRFIFDTAVSLNADCSDDVLQSAFELCERYEKMLSRTVEDSDVSRINNSEGAVSVSDDTVRILSRAMYYSELSGGKFDVTIYPVSSLWDFKNAVVPSRDEIAEALKNVDYQSVSIDGNTVTAGKSGVDLGGIAKGYIADRVEEYLKDGGAKRGIINLGGNIKVFGRKTYTIGIKKPFSGGVSASVKLKDKSIVTSGVYERCFEKDGILYHHILDPETGYPCKTDLYSATVIGDSSLDCDALATVCILSGREKAEEIIESANGFEAIFIDSTGKLYATAGLEKSNGEYRLSPT